MNTSANMLGHPEGRRESVDRTGRMRHDGKFGNLQGLADSVNVIWRTLVTRNG